MQRGGLLYCPHDPVRRDQMASFLARGFELPAATEDFFPDDEGNTHEDNINRVAAAGITQGFEDGTFGPGWFGHPGADGFFPGPGDGTRPDWRGPVR